MNSTDIDICSQALIMIGCDPISSLADHSEEARVCKNQYPRTLKKCLAMDRWSFAIKYVQLTPTQVTPLYGYQYAYLIPGDYLKLDTMQCEGMNYKRVENHIYINITPLRISYVYQPREFPPNFAEFVAYELAVIICEKLTGDSSRIRELKLFAEEARQKAVYYDKLEESTEYIGKRYVLNTV